MQPQDSRRRREWLAIGAVQPWFGTEETWSANYRDYVAEKIDSDECLWDHLANQIYLGTESWLKSLRKKLDRRMHTDAHPSAQRNVGRPVMNTIINAIAKVFGVNPQQIENGHGGLARLIAAWIGWYEGLARLRSIAAALRIRSSGRASTLVQRCEEMTRSSANVCSLIDRVYEQLAA